MKVENPDVIKRMFDRLTPEIRDEVNKAVQKNGDELVKTAALLIPVVSGENKRQIKGTVQEDGGYLADFGPKAKVIEGEKGPRPFVNPALKALRKRHTGRASRALKAAIKKSVSDA